jgi:hypothetical protein
MVGLPALFGQPAHAVLFEIGKTAFNVPGFALQR